MPRKDDKPSRKTPRKPQQEAPKVNPELPDIDIKINSFGEIISNYDIDQINDFLNKNVKDKKLKDRNDLPFQEGSDEEA